MIKGEVMLIYPLTRPEGKHLKPLDYFDKILLQIILTSVLIEKKSNWVTFLFLQPLTP